jgi:Sulfotransferase family
VGRTQRDLPLGAETPVGRIRHVLRGTPLYPAWRRVISWIGARRMRDALSQVETYLLFLGHGRSGHSIVGALLDAHPEIACSDELDALRYLAAGFSREQLLWLSVKVARDQARSQRRKRGRGGSIYSYAVPGSWQGRHRRLRVVGDSRAGETVQRLTADPGLLERIERTMQPAHVRFIHVIRNPYDNIGTMMVRSGRSFESAYDRYFQNWEGIEAMRRRIGEARICTVRHEDLVTDPHAELTRLCRFLGVEPDAAYLDACAGILYRSPSQSRRSVDWTAEQRALVDRRVEEFAGLQGYTFSGR